MAPILAVLALIVSWLPVALDCRGGPEAVDSYEVVTYEARYLGTVPDAEGVPQVVYSRDVAAYRVPQTGGGPCDSRAYPCLWLPDPAPLGVGDVTYLGDPVAVDTAGNRSDGPCL